MAAPPSLPDLDAIPADALLATIRRLAHELRPGLTANAALGLDASLERDFGLDSLSRVELVARLERQFGVKLAESAFADAETPRDLLRMITHAAPVAAVVHHPPPSPAPAAAAIDTPPAALTTLVEVLDWHAAAHGERVTVTLLEDDGRPTPLTYRDLQADARALACGLHRRGIAPGERVAIMLPTGRDFLAAFYGTLVAGGVPVPLYPPARPSQIEDHLRRIAGVVDNAGAGLLITIDRARPLAHLLRAGSDSMREIATVAELEVAGGMPPKTSIAAGDVAFLQYTSGSTGNPKGVVLTHANLVANLRAMWQASGVDSRDTLVSWLPLYHDMGLIGAVLGSMYIGCRLVLMSPLAFLARPSRWLWAIHEHRGTLSAAPNFAYELCAGKIDAAELAGLDLSSWRLAFNGAEPVAAGTLERFAARFAAHGFRREALTPVYGLAESSVGLAFPPLGRGPRIDRIDRRTLIDEAIARPLADITGGEALTIVACGLPLPGHEIRVADAAGNELPERHQGRVQFRGPSSTRGYFENPEATARLIEGDWLNTGDLGYLAGGELFITGREKDIIIRGGHNIHPHELEEAVAGVAGVRKGGVAVFPASDPTLASERLIVLAETAVADAGERQRMLAEIARLAVDLTGGPADDIVLAPPRTVRKTSSGKIRRAACRELYERGELARTQRTPWQQVLSLALDAARGRLRRAGRAAGEALWAAWFWLVFGSISLPVVVLVLTLPGLDRRRRLVAAAARLALALCGLSPRVSGPRPTDAGAIWVANHASYLDVVVLTAILPPTLTFVGKQELATAKLLGQLLRRLGCVFVERFDAARGVEDTGRIEAQAQAGQSLFFFPEGTFQRAPGLLPFRLGAFIVAARAGRPVVPLVLTGTRSVLRDGQWRPRHGCIEVRFGATIAPLGSDWPAALALRDAARRTILAGVGEPDLGGQAR